MEFKGQARRLQSLDISKIAHTIGCGEDHLHAVMEVETRGGGFDKHGRLKMLFEPHVFYRELSGAKRQEAIAAGLAYRRWGEREYPKDSYPRLHRAMQIDADAALRSASWGLGQIMGFNCLLAGYSSAKAMVDGFLDDEDTHLAGMVEFIISASLDDDLRREDWRGFARGYNGSGYAKHGYHTKLKAAFDKWQRIPDTPFTAEMIDRTENDPNPPETSVVATRGMFLQRGMSGPDVLNLQGIMDGLGYPVGKHDSQFGRLLAAAVRTFQADHDLFVDGKVGDLTWAKIFEVQRDLWKSGAERAVEPRSHTEETLRASGSETIVTADQGQTEIKTASAGTGGLSGFDFVKGARRTLSELSGSEDMLTKAQAVVFANWPTLLILGIAALAYFRGPQIMARIRSIRTDDAVTGKHLGR